MSDLPKIGIDIGTSSIKVVELSPQGVGKWKLLSAASIPAPTGGMTNVASMSASIVKILKEVGVKTKRVVAALPEDQVSSHVVDMPLLSDEELKSAIQWQVEQYIPIPMEKALWSYEVIRRDKAAAAMEILLVATSKTLVAAYTQLLEQSGLEVLALETELTATTRACVPAELPAAMIVDVGARSTDLGVVSRGQLVFARTIPTAGEAFTRAIESSLGLDAGVAEQYKSAYGLASTKLDGKLLEAMKPVLSSIGAEIKKTADFYSTKHPGENIKLVTMSGGAAQLLELVGVLSSQIGIEVAIANPFAKVSLDDNQKKALAASGPTYCVAVGLAMRSSEQ